MLLSHIAAALSSVAPGVYASLQYDQLAVFLETARKLAPVVRLAAPRTTTGLPPLPSNVRDVLSAVAVIPLAEIDRLWVALGENILDGRYGALHVQEEHVDRVLTSLGPGLGLGSEVVVTPCRGCVRLDCPQLGRPLGGSKHEYKAYLYTRRRGVLPIRVMTVYCRGCKTTYRPNYSVTKADDANSVREYYGGVPEYLEVAEHTYVERDLMDLFRTQMAFAHASGENVARIYNMGLAGPGDGLAARDVGAVSLSGDNVWNSFFLHGLLLDAQRRQVSLSLPHRGAHTARFNAALGARNVAMAGTGQPMWAHVCDECEKMAIRPADEASGGVERVRINACVMDGITVGHPRCAVYHCTASLLSPRDRFCAAHYHRTYICAIDGCENPCTDGQRTCSMREHRAREVQKRERGQAIYRLRKRLGDRTAASVIRDVPSLGGFSLDVLDMADIVDVLDEEEAGASEGLSVGLPPASGELRAFGDTGGRGTVTGPSTSAFSAPRDDFACQADETARIGDATAGKGKGKGAKPKRVKDHLSRRWTNNEQLMVRCCGQIISRATFYEAESMSNSLRFILATFPPHFPRALPSYLFYDSNCLLLKHIHASGETRLDGCGLPVDVFHAISKHKDRDEFCQMNCNPAGFPELMDAEDNWVFNSSAAEQANVWFGKFMPVVREMSEVHFNFFLDEMIALYNDHKTTTQRKKGLRPRLVPFEELAGVRFVGRDPLGS